MATNSLPDTVSKPPSEAPKKHKQIVEQSTSNRGQEVLDKLEQRIEEFSQIAKSVGEMNKTMVELKDEVNHLKRKSTDDTETCGSKGKKKPLDPPIDESNNSDSDDVDKYFTSGPSNSNLNTTEFFDELDEFFEDVSEEGDDIDSKLASITNKAITSKRNDEKIKEIQNRHKRPKNVKSLQIPKVDKFLWDQLKSHMRSTDYVLQRCHSSWAQVAVPLIKALGEAQTSQNSSLKSHLSDAFKLITSSIAENIHTRRER
ncbi:hypothetical protein DPMN_062023 [Dreissena polymorpha]|uniref:Uncharacterized protein n=1 Tax=Dreissena polymorpha TaxID=45954 RepID=A0A9D4C8U6_DREPO|nr:hypothetical protein DPMN_062023 [Dreissena polymorpha]